MDQDLLFALARVAWLIGAIGFVLRLFRMNSPATARNGNLDFIPTGGVTPGKGGAEVDGIPVYDSVRAAAAETSPNTAMVFVPARFAADAIYESVDAGIETVYQQLAVIPALDIASNLYLGRPTLVRAGS